MNLIMMRTESDRSNAWWLPHATSTPLKRVPDQLEVKNRTQKQPVIQTDFVNVLAKLQNSVNKSGILQDQPANTKLLVPKRSRKSRLSTYFDSSSSSEDDSSETKRPIIKLSSGKSTEDLLRNKEPENEEPGIVNISTRKLGCHKNSGVKNAAKSRKKSVSAVENLRNENDQVQIKKNKVQVKNDFCTENICPDSDEENRIFNKCKENKLLRKNIKPYSSKKVKSLNPAKGDENYKVSCDSTEIERRKLQVIPKANQVLLKPKPTEGNTVQDSQDLKILQKVNAKSSKLSKLQTIKSKKIVGPLKKLRTGDAVSENVVTATRKQLANAVIPITSQNKANLSHQLFSESTEQEYINTLDLTSCEYNEISEAKRCSLQKGSGPSIWPYNVDHKAHSKSKDEEQRPKRRKRAPQKYWMPKTRSQKSLHINNACKEGKILDGPNENVQLLTNSEEILKEKNPGKISGKNCFFRNQEGQNEAEQEPVNVCENETAADDPKNESFENKRTPSNDGLNCSGAGEEINKRIQANEVYVKDTCKCVRDKNTVNLSEKSVFKKLDELSFNGNGSGCSVVQCWNLNNFKCGVFKLKAKSNLTCRTLHSNSHLGGILIRGNLRMKIGTKEQDLKEGDMAFIPPLTEWTATNTGECESVFYYWCGRFDS